MYSTRKFLSWQGNFSLNFTQKKKTILAFQYNLTRIFLEPHSLFIKQIRHERVNISIATSAQEKPLQSNCHDCQEASANSNKAEWENIIWTSWSAKLRFLIVLTCFVLFKRRNGGSCQTVLGLYNFYCRLNPLDEEKNHNYFLFRSSIAANSSSHPSWKHSTMPRVKVWRRRNQVSTLNLNVRNIKNTILKSSRLWASQIILYV